MHKGVKKNFRHSQCTTYSLVKDVRHPRNGAKREKIYNPD